MVPEQAHKVEEDHLSRPRAARRDRQLPGAAQSLLACSFFWSRSRRASAIFPGGFGRGHGRLMLRVGITNGLPLGDVLPPGRRCGSNVPTASEAVCSHATSLHGSFVSNSTVILVGNSTGIGSCHVAIDVGGPRWLLVPTASSPGHAGGLSLRFFVYVTPTILVSFVAFVTTPEADPFDAEPTPVKMS
jgi:hypothetical protein